MTDPSDHYRWRELLPDLATKGCQIANKGTHWEIRNPANGGVARPGTRRPEARVSEGELRSICYQLGLDPKAFDLPDL